MQAAHPVIEQSDFHALSCFGCQDVTDFPADFIVSDNVIFHMDMLFCGLQCLDQNGKFFLSVLQDLYPVIMGENGICILQMQANQILVFFHSRIDIATAFLRQQLLIPGFQLFYIFVFLTGKNPCFSQILSQEQVQDKSHNGNKHQNQDPCPGGTGVFPA